MRPFADIVANKKGCPFGATLSLPIYLEVV